MSNEQETPKYEEGTDQLVIDSIDEIHTFMENTVYAIETLASVVRQIKKDHYDSEGDELDENLQTVEETLDAMAEAY